MVSSVLYFGKAYAGARKDMTAARAAAQDFRITQNNRICILIIW